MDTRLAMSDELKLVAVAKSNFSSDIYPAEFRVLHDSIRQGPAEARPNDPAIPRHVRGDFLRWILNDVAATSLFDKDGLQVVSAIIDGDVDLDSSNLDHNLTFNDCLFTKGIHFESAKIRTVSILNSTVNGDLSFQNATVQGDIDLTPGFKTLGYISTYGAQISGDVRMQGAQLIGGDKSFSLSLNIANVKGGVNLSDLVSDGPISILRASVGYNFIGNGAKFKSSVKMTGTTIGADLDLNNIQATLQEPPTGMLRETAGVNLSRVKVGGSVYLSGSNLQCKPTSLSLHNAAVGGEMYLTENLQALGNIDLSGAEINQALYVQQAKLAELKTIEARIGKLFVILTELKALESTGAQIGEFGWAGIINPRQASLNLTRASVRTYNDEQDSWPSSGSLKIIGLVYEDIPLEVPKDRSSALPNDKADPHDRIAWLHLQSREDLLSSQPWMQLAQYVKARGNPEGAKEVLYDMKRFQAWNGGLLTGCKSSVPDYIDENPWRIMYFIGLLWVFGSLIFWRARRMNEKAMAPREMAAFDKFSEHGTRPLHLPRFNAVVYALENVLPVVKFGQDDAWGPNPQFDTAPLESWKRWLPRFSYNWLAFARLTLILLGWALAIILAGVIGDLFKS